MKCIREVRGADGSVADVVRVSNEKAAEKVKSGKWAYCPKSAWKDQGRKTIR